MKLIKLWAREKSSVLFMPAKQVRGSAILEKATKENKEDGLSPDDTYTILWLTKNMQFRLVWLKLKSLVEFGWVL